MPRPVLAHFPATRAVRWLGVAATLAMLGVLAWLGAGIFWALNTPSTPQPVVAIETDPARAAQAIAAHHLFGQASTVKAVAKIGNLPDIKLRGVIAVSRPGERGVAVLAIGGKPSVSVREGDEALPGVTVHRVLARTVELERNGELQSLSLPDRLAPALPARPQIPGRNPSLRRKTS